MKPTKLIGMEVITHLPIEDLKHFMFHRRLKTFYFKGLKCSNPSCTRVGAKLLKLMDRQGNIHIDVFTDDYVHMNVDHIHPKVLGGTMELSNLQPMCCECNSRKGAKIKPKHEAEHFISKDRPFTRYMERES